ncbi:MAG: hypothetical protein J7M38_03055 [Armatimonadetes bacterium]|nr:hypothetical protein [Armatimonadota bacterium]
MGIDGGGVAMLVMTGTGRHNGGDNPCFVDGHAKWMKPDGTSDGTYVGFAPWHYWPNGDSNHVKP